MRVRNSKVTRARHNKVRAMAKGYRGKRGNVFSQAKTAIMRAGRHAYVGRKLKKRDYRQLWSARISALCRANGIMYSRFIDGLSKKGVTVNRKVLSELAANHEPVFKQFLDLVSR